MTTAPASGLEGLAGDALHLVLTVLEGIHGALAGRTVRTGALLVVVAMTRTKVQAARQLAHDHEVHAIDDLGLECGGAGERREDLHGAQVGIEAERLADAQKPLFRARL